MYNSCNQIHKILFLLKLNVDNKLRGDPGHLILNLFSLRREYVVDPNLGRIDNPDWEGGEH